MRLSPFSRFIFFHFSLLSQFFFLLFFPLFSVFLLLFFPSIWLAFCFKILFLGNLASKKKMVKEVRKKTVTKWNKFLLTDNKLMILFHIHSSNFSFFIITSLSLFLYPSLHFILPWPEKFKRIRRRNIAKNEKLQKMKVCIWIYIYYIC